MHKLKILILSVSLSLMLGCANQPANETVESKPVEQHRDTKELMLEPNTIAIVSGVTVGFLVNPIAGVLVGGGAYLYMEQDK